MDCGIVSENDQVFILSLYCVSLFKMRYDIDIMMQNTGDMFTCGCIHLMMAGEAQK